MPSPEFQKTWVGWLWFGCSRGGATFLNYVRSVIPSLSPRARILDFGCGWGRLYRMLMREPFSLVGADSEPAVIQMCREALPYGEFAQIGTAPPYPFREEESRFDLESRKRKPPPASSYIFPLGAGISP